jgi:hypothetical protein
MSSDDDRERTDDILDETVERRSGLERRSLTLLGLLKGGFTPRRRYGRRTGEEDGLVDWHEPDLLFLAFTILLLSVTDAFFTLTLMTNGAVEANPVMANVLREFPGYFATLKMAITGAGVIVLVVMARTKVFRVVRVRTVLQGVLVAYVGLVAYELWLLRGII